MKNPFQYGGVVDGPAFCNRNQELHELVRAMDNSEKLFVYSERRLGKTSLILHALSGLAQEKYATAYVDLWPTDGEASFLIATAKAIAESMSGTADHLLQTARALFTHLVPSVTMDDEGKPKVTFGVSTARQPGPELDEVLTAPVKIAGQGKRKVVVVFDEVQRILEYDSDKVERRLRSAIQKQDSVSYIFLGSRKHLLQKMFLDRSRPLYRSAGHYPLGSIPSAHWLPFIRKKFEDADKSIADSTIQAICDLTEGHPFYTQHLCHGLWEITEAGHEAKKELIDTALKVLLERESYAYTSLWDSLPLNQRRLLKGLASEARGVKPFAGDFVRQHGLRSSSNAQRAVDGLMNRDLIDRDDGSFAITDRFFKIWILRMQVQ